MMNSNKRMGMIVCLGVAAIMVMAALPVRALTINFQESHEWYGQGNTVVYGVYVGNTDTDATIEVVTVGSVYNGPWYGTQAQMKIWSWNGQQLTVEKTKEWKNSGDTAKAVSVYVGDLDDDSCNEIVTVGSGTNGGNYYNELVVWEYVPLTMDYTAARTLGYASGRMFNSVYATQIDDTDDEEEIVVAGVDAGSPSEAILHMFTYHDDSSISLKASISWSPNDKDAKANGVYAKNVDAYDDVEILTAGYIHTSLDEQRADVRAWTYDEQNEELDPKDSYDWNPKDDYPEALSVFAADVGDGADIEIITCGKAYDSSSGWWGDLETFTLSGLMISPDRSAPWQYPIDVNTECSSVYVGDVDGSSPLDIVTVGKTIVSGYDNGQIRVWNYRGSPYYDIYPEDSHEWYTNDDTEAHAVFVGNVDTDGTMEMVSGGQAYDGTRIRAQLAVWYAS